MRGKPARTFMIPAAPRRTRDAFTPLRKGAKQMRKPHRFLYGLCVCLALLALCLLLSALVETPTELSDAANSMPALGAQFMPAVPGTPEPLVGGRLLTDALRGLAPLCALALLLPLAVTGVDANGRVLRKRRYVQSYYPVFKQELACG